MNLTKNIQKEMISDVKNFMDRHGYRDNWCYLWDGKEYYTRYDHGKLIHEEKRMEPKDYCEYFPEKFILGFGFDGDAYDMVNGYSGFDDFEKFQNIFKRYNCWIQNANGASWYVDSDNENTDYYISQKVEEPCCWIYRQAQAPDDIIRSIMKKWWEWSYAVGDYGACVVGEYLEFVYHGKRYRMTAQSPWQGELSWTKPLGQVERMLSEAGATGIYWNCGKMD